MAPEEKKQEPEKLNWKQSIVLYLHDIVYMFVVLVFVLLLVFRVVIVSGTSMNMTLLDGDYLLLLSNTIYNDPKAGDIVVVSKDSFDNGTPIVKRIIATEGQTIDIDFATGTVTVDGVILEEDYINNLTITRGGMEFPLTVEEGCVFAMGDNRMVSRDSRYPEIGQIDEREILGKAIFLMIPGTNKNEFPRDYGRIGAIS